MLEVFTFIATVLSLTQLDLISVFINDWNRLDSFLFLKVDWLVVNSSVSLGDNHPISLSTSVDSMGEVRRQTHLDRPWRLFAIVFVAATLWGIICEPIEHKVYVCNKL